MHHNLFFTSNYKKEFTQIFDEKIMPDDPTIYIANTSYSNPNHAPDNGSNLFILVNAPYISEHYHWETNSDLYADFLVEQLRSKGLLNLNEYIAYKEIITPIDFYNKYASNKGSIYGTSSNSKFSAFARPRNKYSDVDGLYLVGGSHTPWRRNSFGCTVCVKCS